MLPVSKKSGKRHSCPTGCLQDERRKLRLSDPIKVPAGWRLELDIITSEIIYFLSFEKVGAFTHRLYIIHWFFIDFFYCLFYLISLIQKLLLLALFFQDLVDHLV